MKSLKIACLGTGSMGGAIISGLLAEGISSSNITVTVQSESSAKTWLAKSVKALSVEMEPKANQNAVDDADLVLIGVKPAYVLEVLEEIASSLKPTALVISVAAGITTASMEAKLPHSVAVIRAMPNTPSIINLGMTGIAGGSRVTEDQLSIAEKLFAMVGKTLTLPESKIDALSTVSGSGPAYVFYLIEQLTQAAIQMGFNEDEATLLVSETFRGASEYLVAANSTAAQLRAQVTSPNGTTMRAIAELEKLGLAEGFERALQAALARAKELASGQ